MTKALAAALVFAAGAAVAKGEPAPYPGLAFPSYATAAAVNAACDRGLAAANARVRQLERRPVDAGWLASADDITVQEEDTAGPMAVIENAHPDAAIRDAAQACGLRWSEFESAYGQNEAVFRSLHRVRARDGVDRELATLLTDTFEDAGVALPDARRRRAKRLADRIADLAQRFEKRIRDANVVLPFTAAELAGVPEGVWRDKPRDAQGRFLLGVDYPTFVPVLDLAERAETRERMWRAKTDEGGEANLKTLGEIADLRREYARLFGQKSYAAFALRRKMVGSPQAAGAFLDQVRDAVTARERRDIDELRQAKAAHLGTAPEATRIERWDTGFYSERVRRERYAVDQEAFRRYFPPEESLTFVLRVLEKMLGIRYARVPAALWHPDVHTYAVSDAASGKPLATLIVDLYPREGKYNHAAVWPFRNVATRIGRVPQAALLANLDRKGLTLDELETLLHEMGHAVHANLSMTRYAAIGGTNVQQDFGEAPSQMLEDWVYDPKVLKVFAEVCSACPQIPDQMIERAREARDFGKGIRTSRQHLYATYDLALYAEAPVEPLPLWQRMEGATPLGTVAGTIFPAGFGHIVGGYGAGYYGYLWSLVIALDLRTAFAADRLDPAVGARYRATVLSQGRQAPPRQLVRNFLGRETNAKAFFDDLAR